VGAELFHWTKRHADTAKLIVPFRDFAKTPTNGSDVAGVTRVAMHLPNPTAYWSPFLDRVYGLQLVHII
jgi:hypothetical protein